MKNEQWYIDKLGEVVYPERLKCPCEYCSGVYNLGVHITSINHAILLADSEVEYFATKELRTDYENNL